MLRYRDRLRGVRRDDGATLVEMLVAVAILGIAAVAILGGVEAGIRTSDMHRKQSVGGANVRNYVESVQDWIEDGHYDSCDGGVNYSASRVGFAVPAGYTEGVAEVLALAGDGTSLPCDQDNGVQRVLFTMTPAKGAREELWVVLRDPCVPGGAPGC